MKIADTTPYVSENFPGEKAKSIIEMEKKHLCKASGSTTPIVWKEAVGSMITDVDDNRFIDFTSGILVANVGHSHPNVVEAIQEQSSKFLNSYSASHKLRAELSHELVKLAPKGLNRAWLLTTGAEAVESAIKLAKAHTGKSEIVSFNGSFHGKTYLTMGVGGIRDTKAGFGPQASNVIHAPFPYMYRSLSENEDEEVERCLNYLNEIVNTSSTGNIAAVVFESYLGGGGCVVPPAKFVQGIREFCDKHHILLIVDEVQASFGRTGKMFGFEHYGIVPDIFCVAKGLAAGVPTSAVIAKEEIMESLPSGSATTTYGGNPLSCAAALAVIKTLEEEKLVDKAEYLGKVLRQRLDELESKFPLLGEARSIGMVTGLEIVKDSASKEPAVDLANQIVNESIKRGLALISPTGIYGNVIRMMPPLVISEKQLLEGLTILEDVMNDVFNKNRNKN